MSKFNLPTYVKGKSFSEASAIIAKKFKDRNSPEDVATLNELQGRLQQAQEHVKTAQESKSKPQHKMPDGSMMDGASHGKEGATAESSPSENAEGAVPSGAEQLANKYKGGGTMDMLGAAGSLLEMGNTAFGDTGIDTSGASAAPDVPSVAGTTAMGAVSGAAKGASVAGVPGAIVGGAFGGITSFMGGSNDKKDAQTARVNNSFADHNAASNNYKKGGKMNKYVHGGEIHADPMVPPTGMNFMDENDSFMNKSRRGQPLANREAQKTIMDPSSFGLDSAKPITDLAKMSTDNKSYNKEMKSKAVLPQDTPDVKGKIGSGKNYAELLRYAPAAMNAAQLAGLKKPGQVGLDRLTNKYNPQRVDERGMQNAAQNAANINKDAILSSSGGSASSARASLLGSERNASRNLSDAYQKATGENRQDNRKGQQFDANIDKTNMGQSNQETSLNLEQQAAYRTNKSKLLSQIGNDLGGVGKEELLKKYPEMMGMSYNERGEHLQSIADEKARKKLARLLEKKNKSKKG
jgi:hypothetical protein